MQWRDDTTLPTAALRDFSPLNVRFGSTADIASRLGSVRFTPESGQTAHISVCALCAKSGQMHRNKRRARIVEIYSVTATDAGDFAERDLWNIQSSNPDQLILAPANLITFAHFSVYSAMNVANSAGELANTVP